ncbi:HPr family phosphocarrier protein, partial [Pseudomonas aeruginosa]
TLATCPAKCSSAWLEKPCAVFRSSAAGQVASVDSLVGIMGLGVAEQDEVEVICRGEDSEAALDALLAALASATAGAPKEAPRAIAPGEP